MALLAALTACALAAWAAGASDNITCHTLAAHTGGVVKPTGETCPVCISAMCTMADGRQGTTTGCGHIARPMPAQCWLAAGQLNAIPPAPAHCECAWCFIDGCDEDRSWRSDERDYTTAGGSTATSATVTKSTASTGTTTRITSTGAAQTTESTRASQTTPTAGTTHGVTSRAASSTGSMLTHSNSTAPWRVTRSAPTEASTTRAVTSHGTLVTTTPTSKSVSGGGGRTALIVALLIASSVAIGIGAGMALALWYRHYAKKQAESEYAPTPLEAYVHRRS